jgi:hypothetical protein
MAAQPPSQGAIKNDKNLFAERPLVLPHATPNRPPGGNDTQSG